MEQNKSVQLYIDAVNAIEHPDSFMAFSVYKKWDEMISGFPPEYKSDTELQADLPVLKKDLYYMAFPELPLAEAQRILTFEVLLCLNRDIDLGDLLEKRYTFATYGTQEKERQALREAILKNTETIGNMIIGEWLKIFDKQFVSDTGADSRVNDFMIRESRVARLEKNEQVLLRFVIDIYDRYLSTELLSMLDLAILARGSEGVSSGASVQSYSSARLGGQSSIVRLPLLQALSKYENLGNQLISQERIRIKSQSEPVRPSLLYWVKYYRDELGIGHHDSVQRGNFLFRSENGKRLSAEERERVNLVLKSVEENFPLEIDTERQEILFPVFVSAPAPQAPLPVSRPVPPIDDRETRESVAEKFQPRANPAFSFGQGGMAAGATPRPLVPETSGGALSFSSKHVFPAEKRNEAAEATPAPAVPQAPVPQANPFRIRPVSLGKDES